MLNFFVLMQFYESVHINLFFLERKPWHFIYLVFMSAHFLLDRQKNVNNWTTVKTDMAVMISSLAIFHSGTLSPTFCYHPTADSSECINVFVKYF